MNPENVPKAVRELLPLAERWGIGDDGYRTAAVKAATTEELHSLMAVFDESNYEALEEWLAGTAADDPDPSDEYVAFTCLVMAADQAQLELENRGSA